MQGRNIKFLLADLIIVRLKRFTRIYHYYCYYTYLGRNSLYDTFPPNNWVSWTITVTQFFSTGELFCFHRNVSWLISQTFPTKGMREYKMHLWTLNFSSVAWLKKEVQSIPELPTKILECSMYWDSNQAYYWLSYDKSSISIYIKMYFEMMIHLFDQG